MTYDQSAYLGVSSVELYPQLVERFRNAGVRLRMNGQALFVMREEAVERAGRVLRKR